MLYEVITPAARLRRSLPDTRVRPRDASGRDRAGAGSPRRAGAGALRRGLQLDGLVITSYSIHYTKLYDVSGSFDTFSGDQRPGGGHYGGYEETEKTRILAGKQRARESVAGE